MISWSYATTHTSHSGFVEQSQSMYTVNSCLADTFVPVYVLGEISKMRAKGREVGALTSRVSALYVLKIAPNVTGTYQGNLKLDTLLNRLHDLH